MLLSSVHHHSGKLFEIHAFVSVDIGLQNYIVELLVC